jgi:hypothetical protein
MTDSDKTVIIKKIKLISKYLDNPSGLYTGLSIKRFIKQTLLKIDEKFSNQVINSGRWSAYAHISQEASFKNLLNKHELNEKKRVLVNPLVNPVLINELEKKKVKIFTLDVEKDTLQWKKSIVQFFLLDMLKQSAKIDLVIQTCITGISDEIIAQIEFCQKQNIPTLVILPNKFINNSQLQLLSKLKLGSVMYFYGQNFYGKHINPVLKEPLPETSLFLSWFLEPRTSSILEYHLSDSNSLYKDLLEAYYQLLRIKSKTTDWRGLIQNFAQTLLADKIQFHNLLEKKYKSSFEAELKIRSSYPMTKQFALPDLFFELELLFPTSSKSLSKHYLIDKAAKLQELAKKWHAYFSDSVSKRPAGSLEVPTFYKNKCYSKYFIYTNEGNYWLDKTQDSDQKISFQLPIHARFENLEKLPVTNFISKYILTIDLD